MKKIFKVKSEKKKDVISIEENAIFCVNIKKIKTLTEIEKLNDFFSKNKTQDMANILKNRINTLDYYNEHTPRKDAVLFLFVETYCIFGNFLDVKKFKKITYNWISKYFNKACDGKKNVIDCFFVKDKNGVIHSYSLIIPIDCFGKLNSSYYFGKNIYFMKKSYFAEMQNLNINLKPNIFSLLHNFFS